MKLSLFLSLVMGFLSSSQVTKAADEVGNGGDHIRILFQEARFEALEKIKAYAVQEKGDRVNLWIRKNQNTLIDEGLASSFHWAEDLPENCPQSRCACTVQKKFAEIRFSFKACQKRYLDRSDAGKLIIHELVHHFGINDEAFADAVAVRVYSSDGRRAEKVAAVGPIVEAKQPETSKIDSNYIMAALYGHFMDRKVVNTAAVELGVQLRSLSLTGTYGTWQHEINSDNHEARLYDVQAQNFAVVVRKHFSWWHFGAGLGRSYAKVHWICRECSINYERNDWSVSDEAWHITNHGQIETGATWQIVDHLSLGMHFSKVFYASPIFNNENVSYRLPQDLLMLRASASM